MANINKIRVNGVDYDLSVDNQQNYSTEEKVIGTWRDGKPLYEKTLVYTSGWNLGEEGFLSFNIDNIEEIIDYEASYRRSDNTKQFIPNVHPNMTLWGAGLYDFSATGCGIYIGTLANAFTIQSLDLTIRYTKTTD